MSLYAAFNKITHQGRATTNINMSATGFKAAPMGNLLRFHPNVVTKNARSTRSWSQSSRD